MKSLLQICLLMMVVAGTFVVQGCSKSRPEIFITSPLDGAQVDSTFTVTFSAKKVEIAPAGVDKPGSGHYHLLIDTPLPSDLTLPLGADVMHFGKGQSETQLTLTPGLHSLQLILGDKDHKLHQPAIVSKKITILVRGGEKQAVEVQVEAGESAQEASDEKADTRVNPDVIVEAAEASKPAK